MAALGLQVAWNMASSFFSCHIWAVAGETNHSQLSEWSPLPEDEAIIQFSLGSMQTTGSCCDVILDLFDSCPF